MPVPLTKKTYTIGTAIPDVLEDLAQNVFPTFTHWNLLYSFNGGRGGFAFQRAGGSGPIYTIFNPEYHSSSFADASAITDRFVNRFTSQNALFVTVDIDGVLSSEAAYQNELPTGFGITGVSGGPFQAGENLSIDGGTYTATVVSHVVSRGVLFIEGLSPIPNSYNSTMQGLSLSGGTSGATATITTNFRDVFGHWLLNTSEEIYIEGAVSQPGSGDTLTFGGGHTAVVDTVDSATGRIMFTSCTGVIENGESVSWSGSGGGSGTVALAPLNWGRWTIRADENEQTIDDEPIYYGEDADRLLFLIPDNNPIEHYLFCAFGLWLTSTVTNSRNEMASWTDPTDWRSSDINQPDTIVWEDAYGRLCAMGTEDSSAFEFDHAFRPVPSRTVPPLNNDPVASVPMWLQQGASNQNRAELISPFFISTSSQFDFAAIFVRLDDLFIGTKNPVHSVVQPNSWSGSRSFLFSLITDWGGLPSGGPELHRINGYSVYNP